MVIPINNDNVDLPSIIPYGMIGFRVMEIATGRSSPNNVRFNIVGSAIGVGALAQVLFEYLLFSKI